MKLFERFMSKEPESEVAMLHPDFKLKEDVWYFNRTKDISDDNINCKIRFSFDDPKLLDGCQFQAKIGINLDKIITQKYIGFAYANKQYLDILKSWALKFPYAELIENLDSESMTTSESTISILTEQSEEGK